MKRDKGNIVTDIVTTIAGLIFAAYAFLPEHRINQALDFFNNLTPTEQVIEYDPSKK